MYTHTPAAAGGHLPNPILTPAISWRDCRFWKAEEPCKQTTMWFLVFAFRSLRSQSWGPVCESGNLEGQCGYGWSGARGRSGGTSINRRGAQSPSSSPPPPSSLPPPPPSASLPVPLFLSLSAHARSLRGCAVLEGRYMAEAGSSAARTRRAGLAAAAAAALLVLVVVAGSAGLPGGRVRVLDGHR